MHRSGTSALTRVLGALGAQLPSHSFRADDSNQTGYWEPAPLVELHNKMLAATGSGWNDWRAFDGAALPREEVAAYKAEIKRVIAEEYGQASLFLIKDPRVSRFAWIYEEVLAEEGIAVRFLLQNRHPKAVVASLSKRDGMTSGFASLIWLRHVLDAEAATRGKTRAVLWYDGLLDDWRSTVSRAAGSLGIEWPNRIEDTAPEIERFLTRGLQHQSSGSADLDERVGDIPWIHECYTALRRLSADKTEPPEALECLSRIKSEFDGAAAIFGKATFFELAAREGRVEHDTRAKVLNLVRATHEAEIGALETEIGALRAVIATEQGAAAERASDDRATINRLRDEVLQGHTDLSAARGLAEAASADADQRVSALMQLVRDRDNEAAVHAERMAMLKSSWSWRLTAPFRAAMRPIRRFRTSRLGIKVRGAWRHPTNSGKRKLYRANHAIPMSARSERHRGRSRFGPNLRAILRHPLSRQMRREHRLLSPGPMPSVRPNTPSIATTMPAGSVDARLFRRHVLNAMGASWDADFVPLSDEHTQASKSSVKIIAYYLPQFHPIPENDEAWGKGFTEWRNVARTVPIFEEHYQPRLPGELGYYDLRVPDVMRRQVELARQHGIAAFCFHFYWFDGRRLLEGPVDAFLRNKDLDLQFSLCWANENWSRLWDGGDREVIVAQKHSPEDGVAFIRYLDKYFRDRRYLKVDGRPVLTVYRPAIIPNLKDTIKAWRRVAQEMGYPGLYLIATNSFGFEKYASYGFDALSEFPPHSVQARQLEGRLDLGSTRKGGPIYEYASVVDYELGKPVPCGIVHPGTMPSWDNSARRPYDGHIFHGATPTLFKRWLGHCIKRAKVHPDDEQFVFINAWNEWAEGAYLEPDQRYGYAYLAACAEALRDHIRPDPSGSPRRVSAIVPNYNHARFLRARLDSILGQTVPVDEIVILDDASTDESLAVIADITRGIKIPVKTVVNDTNSGNVFSQWAKGIGLAEGDIIWICESDDSCAANFLEILKPYFADASVMLSFGKVEYIDEKGNRSRDLEGYMEGASPGSWQSPRVDSAHAWFQGPFGIRNVIPNVGACLFRRQQIQAELLAEATSYRVCGDWYLYSRLAHGGRIAYDPSARAYFRRHGANTSIASFGSVEFYEEHVRIGRELRRHYNPDADTIGKMLAHVYSHYEQTFGETAAREFASRHPIEEILAEERAVRHVLIALYALDVGGGELLPIHLANALVKRGYDVSLLVDSPDRTNPCVRALVAPEIAIFTKALVEDFGVTRFLKEFGVTVLHTHNIIFDNWLHEKAPDVRIPYVVSHHGSYEAAPPSQEQTTWLLGHVDHWVYVADKNLGFAQGFPRKEAAFTKLANAMPLVEGSFRYSRLDLGIEPEAFVFGLASRAIVAKGWDVAIRAMRSLQATLARPIHLILCGEGEDLDVLKSTFGDAPHVHFLGYQTNIQAFYRMCDCCVLPTRYIGESYPLTLIEAIQAGTPAIATDVGEIAAILEVNKDPMGLLVPFIEEDTAFQEEVARAMRRVLDRDIYDQLCRSVTKHRNKFSIDQLVDDYISVYDKVIR
jgi:lipopolysaccharide biosynthesis protein/glycosyltransferase involved in cell wall biosynthesis